MVFEKKFNKEKFKAVLHYIINECGCKHNVGRTVVYKLLYFSDFNFFELYEKSLTNETYKKYIRGPVPSHFYESIEELIEEDKVLEEFENFIEGRKKYNYSSLKKPDISLLNDMELAVIDDVIEKLSSMTANQISDYSHGDMPWRATEDSKPIKYSFVFYRDPDYSVRVYDE